MAFFVHRGRIEVTLHQTSFHVRSGGVFYVPRGNYYGIRNTGATEAVLFFTQATDTLLNSQLGDEEADLEADTRRVA